MAAVTNYSEELTSRLEELVVSLGGSLPSRDKVWAIDDYHLDLLSAAVTAQSGGATFTIGAENTNAINVAVQLTDGAGAAVAKRTTVYAYLSNDANGDAIVSSGTLTSAAIGTDGLADPVTTNKSFMITSEADGQFDLTVTDTGTPTMYLIVVLPNGKRVASGAITFA